MASRSSTMPLLTNIAWLQQRCVMPGCPKTMRRHSRPDFGRVATCFRFKEIRARGADRGAGNRHVASCPLEAIVAPAPTPLRTALAVPACEFDTAPTAGKIHRHPLLTADGEPRARVELSRLPTLWFNTGTLCNIACRNCYIKSSPKNDRLAYITREEVALFLEEISPERAGAPKRSASPAANHS